MELRIKYERTKIYRLSSRQASSADGTSERDACLEAYLTGRTDAISSDTNGTRTENLTLHQILPIKSLRIND